MSIQYPVLGFEPMKTAIFTTHVSTKVTLMY